MVHGHWPCPYTLLCTAKIRTALSFTWCDYSKIKKTYEPSEACTHKSRHVKRRISLLCKDTNIFSNPSNMNIIFSFLKKSNRYKHLIGGLLVGLCALSPWAVIYSTIIAASCLALKDKLHGCPWDWLDGLTQCSEDSLQCYFDSLCNIHSCWRTKGQVCVP